MKFEKVVYIASVGYSGSTLLDMLLGAQEDFFSLGEVTLLARYARSGENCTCGNAVSDCDFWRRVENQIQTELGQDVSLKNFDLTPENINQTIFRRLPSLNDIGLILGSSVFWNVLKKIDPQARQYAQASQNTIKIFEVACKLTNNRIVVDSSKYALPLKAQYLDLKKRQKVIFLVRDGRGTCASLMKRKDISMEQAAHRWVRFNKNLKLVMLSMPNDQVYILKYEDLCKDTDHILSELTEFIGVDRPISKTSIIKESYHNIGGNPMRFRREETVIRLDESWKEALDAKDLLVFDKIAGKMNGSLGYI